MVNQNNKRTDWSSVNRVIERYTGKPTPTQEQIDKLYQDALAEVERLTREAISKK